MIKYKKFNQIESNQFEYLRIQFFFFSKKKQKNKFTIFFVIHKLQINYNIPKTLSPLNKLSILMRMFEGINFHDTFSTSKYVVPFLTIGFN